jgi:transposase InsO family protein
MSVRRHECRVRWHVVQLLRWAVGRGVLIHKTAVYLGISIRTLRHWRRHCRDDLEPRPRGRPPVRSSQEVRGQVLKLLDAAGPSTALQTLRPLLPKVARAELARMLRRFRRVRRLRYGWGECRLTWHRVGAVWAMDFVLPTEAVEDRFPCVLSVCDLSSRFQLLWEPMEGETAEVVIAALRTLFQDYGPPLVLKSDNGSAFIAEVTAALLAEWDVVPLFSPVCQPHYNGTCERLNGTARVLTTEQASRAGHPHYWTREDLQWARLWHNEVRRPVPLKGCTPGELWNPRVPLSAEERGIFLRVVEANRLAERALHGYAANDPLDHRTRAAIDRVAVRDALCAHGYLTITARKSRAVSPPATCASELAACSAGMLAHPPFPAAILGGAGEAPADREPYELSQLALAAPQSRFSDQEIFTPTLASPSPSGKLQVGLDWHGVRAGDSHPAHVGQGHFHNPRRPITPRIDSPRAAKIR